MLESPPWWQRQGRAGWLANPATTQAQNQGYVSAHPNITPSVICWSGGGDVVVLRTQGRSIFMTPGANGMS